MTRGGRRSGAGRPAVAGTPRSVQLHVYASEAEAGEILAAVQERGVTLTSVGLELLLQWARGGWR